MINIVFGLVAICLGIWGLVTYWWYTVDVIIAIFPLVLLIFGHRSPAGRRKEHGT